jgi:hypothetical protein
MDRVVTAWTLVVFLSFLMMKIPVQGHMRCKTCSFGAVFDKLD